MSGISDAIIRRQGLIQDIGKAGLNALFPRDFEYYQISFELVDSTGKTIEFFTFPIMADSIRESQPKLTNIKKTAGGITSLKTSTFVPRPIVIKGTFGRKFKFLLGGSEINFAGISFSTQNGIFSKEGIMSGLTKIKDAVFNTRIKTGYGCIKILEAIIDKSDALDNNNSPHSLYFYNPALGNNYIVEPISFDLHQDKQENNMFWGYTLQMMAIAPLGLISGFDPKSLTRNLTYGLINKRGTDLVGSITKSLGRL